MCDIFMGFYHKISTIWGSLAKPMIVLLTKGNLSPLRLIGCFNRSGHIS